MVNGEKREIPRPRLSQRLRATGWAVALAAAALTLAACGSGQAGSGTPRSSTPAPQQSSSTPAPQPSTAPTPGAAGGSKYLSVDSSSRTVMLTLDITGFNFNGDSNGQMTVQVPEGWTVTVNCHNDASIPHSCAIVPAKTSTSVAFSGASTSDATQGLQPGTSQTFSFTADKVGHYAIVCLVPGHEEAGMWDRFDVTSAGTPSITT